MQNFILKIKLALMKDWVTPFFLALFLIAWTANAFKKTVFDLGQLQTMYIAVRGASIAQHGIDSGLNSPRGEMPRGEA